MSTGAIVKPVVVVPVHKQVPTAVEKVSLRQCGKVLGQREIRILAPEGLNLASYDDLLPGASALRVPPYCMESIQAYNRMMISPLIFEALDGYTHMLLHEPDAIVLRDEVDFWCSQPFDYIGAPWFVGFDRPQNDSPFLGVGNFGFSMHRLTASRRVMSSKQRWYPYRRAFKEVLTGLKGSRSDLRRGLRALGINGELRGASGLYSRHCDLFWSFEVPAVDNNFKIAPVDDAVRFAWEVLPARCMQICNGRLPFGIHAWAKYDLDFLAPYLVKAGVNMEAD